MVFCGMAIVWCLEPDKYSLSYGNEVRDPYHLLVHLPLSSIIAGQISLESSCLMFTEDLIIYSVTRLVISGLNIAREEHYIRHE